MSLPNGPRLSDSIASKLIEGGFPVDLDGLRFNAALNIWEFVPFGGGGGTTHMAIVSHADADPSSLNTFLIVMGGPSAFVTNETLRQAPIPRDSTFSKLGIDVNANSQTVDSHLLFRVNGSSVNLDVTITFGVTGFFEDAVNTDAVLAEDLVAKKLEVADAGLNFDLTGTCMEYT